MILLHFVPADKPARRTLRQAGFGGIVEINGITAKYINRKGTMNSSAESLRSLFLCVERNSQFTFLKTASK